MREQTHGRTVVGDVLLAIGARSTKEAVGWSAAARAVAVILRAEDDDSTFEGLAEVSRSWSLTRPFLE